MLSLGAVLVIAGVAVASSVLTALVLVLVARRMLERRLEAAGAELEQRVVAGVERGAEQVLPRLREQVEAGVHDGAEEVLPQLRREVGEGVREALLGKAGERLARTGSSVLGAGLDLLLGREDNDGPKR